MRELSIVGFPSFPTERRERGTVLWYPPSMSGDHWGRVRDAPNGLVILFLGRPRLKESVLANVDSTLDFSDLNDWVAHLGAKL